MTRFWQKQGVTSKANNLKKIISGGSLILVFLTSFVSSAQQSDLDLLVNDLLKISSDFAIPAAEATVYQSDAGWFFSAKSLDPWQVDVSVHGNALFVPHGKSTTQVSNSDYDIIKIRGAESVEIPTAFGGDTDIFFDGKIDLFGKTTEFEFQALEGMNKKVVYHTFVQASIGLPMKTEISIRFVPIFKIDEVEILTYGIGLKHNISQYFTGVEPSDFQFAALVGYSKFEVYYEYDPLVVANIVSFDALEVNSDLWTLQLISSKSFKNSPWEIFGAVGITNSRFEYKLGGEGIALESLNNALKSLSERKTTVKGYLGFNYTWHEFMLSSALSFGNFYNYNLGLHYRL